jgi:hypothetical protein
MMTSLCFHQNIQVNASREARDKRCITSSRDSSLRSRLPPLLSQTPALSQGRRLEIKGTYFNIFSSTLKYIGNYGEAGKEAVVD